MLKTYKIVDKDCIDDNGAGNIMVFNNWMKLRKFLVEEYKLDEHTLHH